MADTHVVEQNQFLWDELTDRAVLFVRATKTTEDEDAIKVVKRELGNKVRIVASDTDPYDVRPRLEAGRGAVYRGASNIKELFETIHQLAPLSRMSGSR
jgi:hypothetical protein